jgi:hypothetical protein
MFWTRVGCFQHGGQDPEVTCAGTKTSKVPTRVNLLPYIYSVPVVSISMFHTSATPPGLDGNWWIYWRVLAGNMIVLKEDILILKSN